MHAAAGHEFDEPPSGDAPPAQLEWELAAEPANVSLIRGRIEGFAAAHGADRIVLADIALAVSEAATNAVVHAFIDREPGTISAAVRVQDDAVTVVISDDGRGMQPRPDSPGLGLGLPMIGRLTANLDIRMPEGGGTELTMTFDAPGVRGPEFGFVDAPDSRAQLLEDVARTAEGAWPGEGVEHLADLIVPAVADACAVDVVDEAGRPQRFAGRIDGPDGARRSAWLAGLRPRPDAPGSSTRAALLEGEVRVAELTTELIAAVTTNAEDAAEMAATGVRWWTVLPLREGERLIGLMHFGMRSARGRPSPDQVALFAAIAERAAHALANTQLVAELRRTRRRFERILDVLAEAVTVHGADGQVVYANEAAARLLGAESIGEVVRSGPGQIAERFEITRADGSPVSADDFPGRRLLAGLDAPPLLTRSVHRESGVERWLLTKATLLDEDEPLAVNVIEDVTDSIRED